MSVESNRLERDLNKLISEHGVKDVLAALCRWCDQHGRPVLFHKLNSVYEWSLNRSSISVVQPE